MLSAKTSKLIEQYLTKFEGKTSYKIYKSEIELFINFLDSRNKDIFQLSIDDMHDYKQSMIENVNSKTIKRKFSILNQFFKFLENKITGFKSPIGQKYGDMLVFQASNYSESETFENNLNHWIETLICNSTKKTYGINVKLFFEAIKKAPNELKQSDFNDYKKYLLQEKNQKHSTVWNKFISINSFFKFLSAKNRKFKNPMSIKELSLIPPKKDKGYYGVLNEKEVEQLLNQPDRGHLMGIRDYAILRLMLTYGLRAGEICKLKHGDLERERVNKQQKLWIKDRKGRIGKRKDTDIILNGKVLKAFDDWLNNSNIEFQDETPIFAGFKWDVVNERLIINMKRVRRHECLTVKTIENIIARYTKSAKLNDHKRVISPHAMRHTALTMLAKAGVELIDLKFLAAHEDVSTTMIYLHSVQSYEDHVGMYHPLNK